MTLASTKTWEGVAAGVFEFPFAKGSTVPPNHRRRNPAFFVIRFWLKIPVSFTPAVVFSFPFPIFPVEPTTHLWRGSCEGQQRQRARALLSPFHAFRNLSEGTVKLMATSLDQRIAQLEKIVDTHLDLCKAMRNGLRCVSPANHEPTQPHNFPAGPLKQQLDSE